MKMKIVTMFIAFFFVLGVNSQAQGVSYPYSVVLTWTPPSGATGINVYRTTYSSGACGTFALLTTTSLTGTAKTYTDTTVASLGDYCYGVTALVGAAESGMSNIPPPSQIPPTPPTALATQEQ